MLCAMVRGQFRWNLPGASARYAASKVPQVTIYFWIIKVLITGASAAGPDYLVRHFGAVIVGGLAGTFLVAALALQFSVRRYNAWVYWLAVVPVSVAGTEAANGLHTALGFPYIVSAACWLVVLTGVLVTWRASEQTLSLRSIDTPRREMFYWAAVLAAFALGGAVGHLTATVFRLGFSQRGYLASFAALTGVLALAWWRFGLNPVVAFWLAYVVTRPLGAGFAGWLAAPRSAGGLGMGRWPVSLGLAIVIVGLVGYLAVTRKDVQDPAGA